MLPDGARSEEKQAPDEGARRTRRRNHRIGISYGVKVALLVSGRRTVCRMR